MTTDEDHECFPSPTDVTEGGRTTFDNLVKGYARELAGELDVRALRAKNAGRSPKQTDDNVQTAADELVRTRTGVSRSRGRTAFGTGLITTSTAGPTIVAGILSPSLPSILTSVGFAVALLLGLWLLLRDRSGH